jgi:prepilin-type N-terminal cleavage/methylation domain-containing protein
MLRAFRPSPVEPADRRSAGSRASSDGRFRAVNVRLPVPSFLKQCPGWADPSAVDNGFGYRVRARLASERGFTLIEVLVSALLVVLISAAVAEGLITSSDFTGYTRNHSQADVVAQQDQERMKAMSDEQLTALHQTRTVSLNNTQYTVASTATFLDATGGSSCTSKGTAYFKLTSNVSWSGVVGGAGKSVTEESVITRSLAGTLVATVNDQTATPLSGVNIGATGQTTNYTAGAITDQNGCVAFAGLPSDSFTLTYTDLGFVDVNGLSSPTQTQVVNQTSTAAANTEVMGQAGTVAPTFQAENSSHTVIPANGYELSYYGSGNGNKMSAFKTVGSQTSYAASLSGTSLFPFWSPSTTYNNNYQLWAGACEQEQALQPPTGSGAATVAPGAAGQSPTGGVPVVAEPAVDVAVKYNGTLALPTDVWMKFTSSTGTACSDVWKNVPSVGTETVSGTTYAVYAAPFASTSAAGTATASATGDKGTLSVCADYNHSGTYKYEYTTGFANTNFTAPTIAPIMDLGTSGSTGHCQ